MTNSETKFILRFNNVDFELCGVRHKNGVQYIYAERLQFPLERTYLISLLRDIDTRLFRDMMGVQNEAIDGTKR